VTLKKTLLTLLSLFLVLAFIGCSENADQQSNPTSSYTTAVKGDTLVVTITGDEKGSPNMALSTATATFSVRGPSNLGYWTFQVQQNGYVWWQSTTMTLPGGYRYVSISGLPAGCGYIANVWNNFVGIQSHTWPSKCISGSTHLGCLQFNSVGEPSPWQGSCP
jgi:hypothetical protein